MNLGTWSSLLGAAFILAGASALAVPATLARGLTALPRHKVAGYLLSAIAWIWAGYALWNMGLDFLEPYKRFIPLAVLVCTPLSWVWLDNLLPCRAIGGILTLLPYELLHVARVHASPWRLVLVTLSYVLIIAGMTLLLYPWKLRQALQWLTASSGRMRVGGVLDLALGLLLVALGVTVLR